MSASLTQATLQAIAALGDTEQISAFALCALLLLLVLLILKEVVRSLNRPQAETALQAINVAIVPLLMLFGFVVLLRLVAIL